MKTIQKAIRNVRKLTTKATDTKALHYKKSLRKPIGRQYRCRIERVIEHDSENRKEHDCFHLQGLQTLGNQLVSEVVPNCCA